MTRERPDGARAGHEDLIQANCELARRVAVGKEAMVEKIDRVVLRRSAFGSVSRMAAGRSTRSIVSSKIAASRVA